MQCRYAASRSIAAVSLVAEPHYGRQQCHSGCMCTIIRECHVGRRTAVAVAADTVPGTRVPWQWRLRPSRQDPPRKCCGAERSSASTGGLTEFLLPSSGNLGFSDYASSSSSDPPPPASPPNLLRASSASPPFRQTSAPPPPLSVSSAPPGLSSV